MKQFPNTLRTLLLSFFTLISGYALIVNLGARKTDSRSHRRGHPARFETWNSVTFREEEPVSTRKRSAHSPEMIRKGGFGLPFLTTAPRRRLTVPRAYKPLDQIYNELLDLQRRYPDLVYVESVGKTTAFKQPIWGARVSDNAATREDEPRILFVGVHHAREPIGSKICLEIIKRLCRGYGKDQRITDWVNSMEIWLVPVVNPDGYQYILENNLTFPWWRKNLRDNDGDGVFNPLYDGVDLNRNYDFNWSEGGDGKSSSWFFRGEVPFSEEETRAIMNLALRENFVIGISYHSYGESILFPWGNFKRPPDLELIVDIASEMAAHITKESGRGKYSILPLNGRVGQSSIWMYGQLRTIDYIVEVGTEYFPAPELIPFILKENVEGAFYLLDRLLETGVKGHVFDRLTGEPLLAEIEVKELAASHVKPRRTDPMFGSFHRLLNPGRFTLEIRSKGYYPQILKRVKVAKGELVNIEIALERNPIHYTNSTTSK